MRVNRKAGDGKRFARTEAEGSGVGWWIPRPERQAGMSLLEADEFGLCMS